MAFGSLHPPTTRSHVCLRQRVLANFHRRDMLFMPSLVAAVDPRTLANSVLSGYGLPTIGNAKGFTPYDNFSSNYEFDYPKSWVVRCASLGDSRESCTGTLHRLRTPCYQYDLCPSLKERWHYDLS